jgi:exoribonuclease R
VPSLRVVLPVERLPHGQLDLEALLDEVGPPREFSPEALAEAERAAASPSLPALDRTDVPLVTLDPPGSTDLDQAYALERRGPGYRLHYAIADPAAFVPAGGALSAELDARGVTLYLPGLRVPLHPPVLGEGAASLLPGVDRPSVLWTLDLDAEGSLVGTDVRRALVRSRAQLDYPAVQAEVDAGRPDALTALLREVGQLRQEQARARGAVDLPSPSQEVELGEDGRPQLHLRLPSAVEGWNAQLSLLTGIAAAALMLDGAVGLLRTLPPPQEADVEALRRGALALGVRWPEGATHGEVVSGLDPGRPEVRGRAGARHPAAARRRLHAVRRRRAGPAAARRGGCAVRALHRAAAPAGRPHGQRGLPGAVRRRAGA